ncbi:hypothetical protein [Actinomadura rifamycini]|uniref:hypothetical protein n=1 Tax=Actinomadura rifamycini TaxID=31962 RepID=UPI0003FBFA68|nr:hypothetical protein [Actinomadura rifamycini]
MSTLVTTVIATTTADGISPRVMTLLLGSIVVALVGGFLGYIVCDGTQNKKFAAGTILAVVAFAGAYSFFNDLVSPAPPTTVAPLPPGDPGAEPTHRSLHDG